MDLDRMINELCTERNRVNEIIKSLEAMDNGAVLPHKKRGRKSMDGEARKEVSLRMKKYWAAQRRKRAGHAEGHSVETALDTHMVPEASGSDIVTEAMKVKTAAA